MDKCPSEELRQYYLRKEELTIEDSILLWGLRVVLPQTLRFTMLNLLHDTHIGVVRMKTWHAHAYGGMVSMRILNVSVLNVFLARNIQKILPNLHFQ